MSMVCFWPISASRHQQRWVDSCLLPPDQKQSLGCGYKIRGDSTARYALAAFQARSHSARWNTCQSNSLSKRSSPS